MDEQLEQIRTSISDCADDHDRSKGMEALNELEDKIATLTRERDVAKRALEILQNRELIVCPERICSRDGNCRQCEYDRTIAQAERELALVETVEKIEAAHEHAAESKLVFGEDKDNESC